MILTTLPPKIIFNTRLRKYYLRDPFYFKEMNLYLLKNRATKIHRSDGESSVELENKQRIQFDALLYAGGSAPERETARLLYLKHVYMAESITDRPKLKLRLRDSKKICINSLNLESLEIASKIKEKFPEKQVMILDHRRGHTLRKTMGPLVSKDFIEYFKKAGVHFQLGTGLENIDDRGDKGMLLNFKNGKKLKVDMIIDNTRTCFVRNNILKNK